MVMTKGWVTEKPSWQRPKGTYVADYAGYQSWSYQRWAWEFLRRNEGFIEACDAVAEDDLARQVEIAAAYKLKRFRHYGWEFQGTKAAKPRFLPSDVSFWVFKGEHPTHHPKLSMQNGQIFVRFDLAQAILDSGAIEAQLRKAHRVLNNQFKKYIQSAGIKPPRAHKPRKDDYLRLIRLLDLLDADGRKATHSLKASALRAVNNDDPAAATLTVSEVLARYRYQIATARRYADSDYQFVAAHPDAIPKKSGPDSRG
ncbi:MAG: hypothetical protein KF891_01375 [Rhizobacter sp.]|nr:hypothetical protein [Rhizobacter sp.]